MGRGSSGKMWASPCRRLFTVANLGVLVVSMVAFLLFVLVSNWFNWATAAVYFGTVCFTYLAATLLLLARYVQKSNPTSLDRTELHMATWSFLANVVPCWWSYTTWKYHDDELAYVSDGLPKSVTGYTSYAQVMAAVHFYAFWGIVYASYILLTVFWFNHFGSHLVAKNVAAAAHELETSDSTGTKHKGKYKHVGGEY